MTRAASSGRIGACAAAAAAALAAGTGCTIQLNDRPTIGGELLLPAVAPTPVLPSAATLESPTPPPLTIERDLWEPVAFVVPVDGAVHWPTFTTPLRVTDPESRRKIGLYPTLLSSLETRQMGLGESAWEITVAPFLALWEAALIPVRAVTIPAGRELQSPGSPPLRLYKRTDGEQWFSGSGTTPGLLPVTVEPEPPGVRPDLTAPPAGVIESGPDDEELPDDVPGRRVGEDVLDAPPPVPEPTPGRTLPPRPDGGQDAGAGEGNDR